MKKVLRYSLYALYGIAFVLIFCSYPSLASDLRLLGGILPLFLALNVFVGALTAGTRSFRMRVCFHGALLLVIFALSLIAVTAFHIVLAVRVLPEKPSLLLWSAVYCIVAEAIVLWNGILCVYCTSHQLGVKLRVIGAVCGMIPILNLIVLFRILKTVFAEVSFESFREARDRARKNERVCETKYPILFVHGVFFRDTRYFNYWGRIPKALEANGATVYYGEHASASSVEASARELCERMRKLSEETGCEKFNVIAHSKGGLDCRYAIAKLGASQYIASLTTINTPHRGCIFAEALLRDIPESVRVSAALAYNTTLKKLGDTDPDFLAAVNDLTAERCAAREKEMPVPSGIYCQSVGSRLNGSAGGRFPLNLSYPLVKHYDGTNDGLVGEDSFRFGENYTFVTVSGKRGVSHGDMIDLCRENISEFDVREFYIELLHDLKKRGL